MPESTDDATGRSGLAGSCGPVLVVDGDADDRSRLVGLVESAGYRTLEAVTGHEALAVAEREELGAVVLEVRLEDICGYSVCRELRERFADALPIVFVSGARTESCDRVAGLLLGADDYISKPYAADEFVARLRRLLLRGKPIPPAPASSLTARELEVLRLLARGLGQKEIAHQLFLSSRTVGTHIERIYRKLGVHTRTQAIVHALREELIGVG